MREVTARAHRSSFTYGSIGSLVTLRLTCTYKHNNTRMVGTDQQIRPLKFIFLCRRNKRSWLNLRQYITVEGQKTDNPHFFGALDGPWSVYFWPGSSLFYFINPWWRVQVSDSPFDIYFIVSIGVLKTHTRCVRFM